MIMIRLGFQEHTVDMDGQLFDQGMRQIGHGVQVRVVRCVVVSAGLELDFHFKVTSIKSMKVSVARIKNSIGLIPVVTGRSCVNRTPNMDVSVLRTWNTCNSGLMTRADKVWACIVQRRFKRLARRGRRILLYGLMPRDIHKICLLYTSPSPRDLSTSRMPSSA